MVAGTALHSNEMARRQYEGEKVASMSYTISAEGTPGANQRSIQIQLLDGNGAPVAGKRRVRVHVWATTAQAALATGGSTGLAVASGTVLIATITAKLVLEFLCNANGLVNLTWTDTGTESVCLEAECDGIRALSAAFANA